MFSRLAPAAKEDAAAAWGRRSSRAIQRKGMRESAAALPSSLGFLARQWIYSEGYLGTAKASPEVEARTDDR